MRIFVMVMVLLALAAPARAATAYWAGQMESVTTVTGKQAIRCQYNVNGQLFWRVFLVFPDSQLTTCPMQIEVE